MRACAVFVALLSAVAFSQPAENPPRFEITDVHASAKVPNAFLRTGPVRNGRYEIRNATMVDLVRLAYGVTPDKVLDGPNWLELDRFDVIAKVPPDSTPETQKLMLQALLADRFKLVVRQDTRPLPAYVLTTGKNVKLKEADGSGDTGCKMQSAPGPAGEGGGRIMVALNGNPQTIALGPGGTIAFVCRNLTMAAFADGLRGMLGASVGQNPVQDHTGLKGAWNFEVHWSLPILGPVAGAASDRITVFDAVDKQLGLKLEQIQIPTPVIVVESANRTPTENPPGLAEALPTLPAPSEFEVAEVKLSGPASTFPRFQMQPGGRFTSQGMPMRFLIGRAFNGYSNDQILGVPNWADSQRFDITAKAPSDTGPNLDPDQLAPMIRALLADRFKMTYHSEKRPLAAYTLVAAKPKMKKADPASRIFCRTGPAAPGSPPGSILLTCQNITMALFAERLPNLAPGLTTPVEDNTSLEGGWDLTLTFSQIPPALLNAPPRSGGDPGQPGAVQAASDPVGGYTIFEAIERQLGLKLESRKRPVPVIVIDHLEQQPTDN